MEAMFARNALRLTVRARPPLAHPRIGSGNRPCIPQCRRYSANASPGTVSVPQATGVGALAPFVSELDKLAPSFDIKGSDIRILRTPTDFYETLKEKIRKAERRVFLSTLYIGKSEQELIDTLAEALRNNPKLTVSILTDALRGTREAPNPSCASLLAPLVEEFGADRVEIHMYHTPNLTGLRKKHIPRRINEGWGLQHMKLYGMDDEIILSGANLSSDYFTNRQDRYHLFQSKDVTDYFWRIHQGVSSFSFLVAPSAEDPAGFKLTWPASNGGPSPLDAPNDFVRHASSVLRPLITPNTPPPPPSPEKKPATEIEDTRIYILAQMSQLLRPDISTELPAITHILRTLARPEFAASSWTFTAGYFNPAPSLTKLLLSTSPGGQNTVITASPYANGFYKSPGVSGLLPGAYTVLLRRFLDAVYVSRRADIQAMEWRRGTVGEPGAWTYHAKGLWISLPREASPSMTLVGSSNYTKRSYSLDLEVGGLMVTRDEDLKRRLAEEKEWLTEHAGVTTRDDLCKSERRVGIKVRIAMLLVKLAGGAL
ncbi:hypothetical protein jhhlp_005879 [Lomentospora prolificans]|uniref:CDP-diacylglycerol--glycerol-3-phosphate 3-phosphatidyltransferase n=1 Tax=Lomentospora prolificans TaxID=41688 RepID=A0A2N3N4C2_9PEZI|nr:hypothetical protein jhhlp_005879 [Lomentospora prolificans]